MSFQLTSSGAIRSINGVKFTCDGRRILAATSAKRVAVLDVERGEQIQCFESCVYNGRDMRIPIETDPICPHLAVCAYINGRGLSLFDLRMPLPLDYVNDLHSTYIRDITFLSPSWPFVKTGQCGLVSLSVDGVCKVTTLDGRALHCFEVGHPSNCLAVTPETYESSGHPNSFSSLMMIGGEGLSRYRPDQAIIERIEGPLKDLKDVLASASSSSLPPSPSSCAPSPSFPISHIRKLKYTSNGSLLYSVTDSGSVKRYRRYPDGSHKLLGEVFSHRGDVYDLDISPYDEFLVTASKDRHVGILCLGSPNHGWTGFCELT